MVDVQTPISGPVAWPENHYHSPRLTKKQKLGLFALGALSLFILILWFMETKNNLTFPLYGGRNPQNLSEQKTNSATPIIRDTDGDGLTDADELNLYKTSPYITDSDSDGLADKQEVDNKTDPNCPVGQTCTSANFVSGNDSILSPGTGGSSSVLATTSPTLSQQAGQIENINQQSSAATFDASGAAALKQAFGDNPDPALLKEKFSAAATTDKDKAAIQALTDAQILELYSYMISGAK